MTTLEADRLHEQVEGMTATQLCLLWRWLLLKWVQKYEEEQGND